MGNDFSFDGKDDVGLTPAQMSPGEVYINVDALDTYDAFGSMAYGGLKDDPLDMQASLYHEMFEHREANYYMRTYGTSSQNALDRAHGDAAELENGFRQEQGLPVAAPGSGWTGEYDPAGGTLKLTWSDGDTEVTQTIYHTPAYGVRGAETDTPTSTGNYVGVGGRP